MVLVMDQTTYRPQTVFKLTKIINDAQCCFLVNRCSHMNAKIVCYCEFDYMTMYILSRSYLIDGLRLRRFPDTYREEHPCMWNDKRGQPYFFEVALSSLIRKKQVVTGLLFAYSGSRSCVGFSIYRLLEIAC